VPGAHQDIRPLAGGVACFEVGGQARMLDVRGARGTGGPGERRG
jgi:hypothetical protein